MQSTTTAEQVSNLSRRIEMTISLAEVEKDVESRLKRMARGVKMPGFRPGKVPLKVMAQTYGAQAQSEAIGEAVERAFVSEIEARKLRVAGQPKIEPVVVDGAEGEGVLSFAAVFEVYPEITPADLSGRSVARPVLDVGDAEVSRTVEMLRKQRQRFEPVSRASAEGDRVIVDFTGRKDGEVFAGGQASDYPVVIGSGMMLKDFENGIVGLEAGQSNTFDMSFPADYHAAELAGGTVQFEVSVKRVEGSVLPEIDEAFAREMGVEDGDVSKFMADVRSNLEREVKHRIERRLKNAVFDQLLDANPVDVPTALVEHEAQQLLERARQEMSSMGVPADNQPTSIDGFRDSAERRVRLGLLLAEIVKREELHATPDQVRAQVDDMASSYEDPEDFVRWYYAKPERLTQVEALVIEQNVVDWALKQLSVTDTVIQFEELMDNAA